MTRVLIVPTDMETASRVEHVTADLATLRGLLNGGWLEGIAGDGDWTGYCDEEGKVKGLPVNPRATYLARDLGWDTGDVLCGPVVFIGPPDDEGDDTDLPDRVIDQAKAMGVIVH